MSSGWIEAQLRPGVYVRYQHALSLIDEERGHQVFLSDDEARALRDLLNEWYPKEES